ncbi:MAG: right-handed parallel beta-helix repeat-containing protein [Planctomycetota bacterium]
MPSSSPSISSVTGLVLVLAVCAAADADTLNVPSPEYPAIQSAIDAAFDGDEVVVAPGTYNEAIDFLGKAITVRSSGGAPVTTIDGSGSFHVVQCASGEGPDSVLDGFTITGGNANGPCCGPDSKGGGMLNSGSSPTVENCTFIGNQAVTGGGMSNFGTSNPVVTACTFTSNLASNSGAGMHNDGIANPVVTGCTFSFNVSISHGGGMFNGNASPIVIDCVFHANTASADTFAGSESNGGGMYNAGTSSPTVSGCTFTMNLASWFGGGMYNLNSTAAVSNCTFDGNASIRSGGGMMNVGGSGSPTVSHCTFSGNISDFNGGGMNNENSSTPTIIDCTFIGNTAAGNGGGMSNNLLTSPTVINCMFTMNTAGGNGGGMSTNTNVGTATPLVTNCTFRLNAADGNGGGMRNRNSSPIVTNCTFHENSALGAGGGMSSDGTSNPIVANSVFWLGSPDQIADLPGAASAVTYSNVQGGVAGTGNIDEDPLFVDVDGPDDVPGNEDDDLRLQAASPCIDAASDADLPADSTDLDGDGDTAEALPLDLDGNSRVIDGDGNGTVVVDMGAYEYLPPVCPADLSGDGNVDIVDLLQLLAVWGDCAGCDEDLDGSGTVDIADLLALLAAWGPCS